MATSGSDKLGRSLTGAHQHVGDIGFCWAFAALTGHLEARFGILVRNYASRTKTRRNRSYLDPFRVHVSPQVNFIKRLTFGLNRRSVRQGF